MRSAKQPARIAVAFRPVDELTDAQLQRLIDLGRREAELLNALEDAVANNDRDLAWQISMAIFEESGKQ